MNAFDLWSCHIAWSFTAVILSAFGTRMRGYSLHSKGYSSVSRATIYTESVSSPWWGVRLSGIVLFFIAQCLPLPPIVH